MKNLERSLCIFALASAFCASSCSSGGSSGGGGVFVVNSTDQGIAGTSQVVVSDEWLVYQADEATTGGGTDLNGDGDMTDAIAAVVDMTTGSEQTLDVAARELYVLDNEIFLVVDESADGRLWNADGDMADRVLLHWSSGAAMPVFVEELDNGGAEIHAAVAGTRLYFSSASNPVAGESSLKFVTAAATRSAHQITNPVPRRTPGAGYLIQSPAPPSTCWSASALVLPATRTCTTEALVSAGDVSVSRHCGSRVDTGTPAGDRARAVYSRLLTRANTCRGFVQRR